MKFTPNIIKENFNISEQNPLKEAVILTGGFLLICLIFYAFLSVAVGFSLKFLPYETEQLIGKIVTGRILSGYLADKVEGPVAEKLQELVDDIKSDTEYNLTEVRVHLVENKMFNALAFPGGDIVVFTGLLKEMESENELVFLLGHELAHLVNRDSLRSLGYGLVPLLVSSFVFGSSSSTTEYVTKAIATVEMKVSRGREKAADLFGLSAVQAKYGHAGGAESFMQRLALKDKVGKYASYFSTHPYKDDRIATIHQQIRKKGFPVRSETPLPDWMKSCGVDESDF